MDNVNNENGGYLTSIDCHYIVFQHFLFYRSKRRRGETRGGAREGEKKQTASAALRSVTVLQRKVVSKFCWRAFFLFCFF